MAMTSLQSTSGQRPKPSLTDLSPELLSLIFEQLRLCGPRAVITGRLLSHRFDAIGIPIQYSHVTFNANIVQPGAEQQWPQVLRRIHAHTQHVTTSSDLDPAGTKRIFDRMLKLRTVRWRYTGDNFHDGPFWMPSDLFGGLDPASRPLELHVDGLPLRHFDGQARDTYLRAIPVDIMVSLSMAHPTPPLTTRLASLKRLLLESRCLHTFHYRDRGQGTYFTFTGSERFPAFKELSLKSYDWNHDANAVGRHWDFSCLRSLELSSVPLFNFLSSVPAAELANLHTLRVEDFSAHLPDQRREASRRLSSLVKNNIRALQVFEATCNIEELHVDALIKHATSLRHLRLNDHIGFAEDDRYCPTIAIEDVQLLPERCTRLRSLELDLDARRTNVTAFLQTICAFPALHTLTLHVPTAIDARADADTGAHEGGANQEVAQRMFDFLVREKARNASRANEEQPLALWQSVTINLGGWRPVMIRRLSEAWQQRNRMGVFAEQCFVWRRDEKGEMKMEELAAVEAQAD